MLIAYSAGAHPARVVHASLMLLSCPQHTALLSSTCLQVVAVRDADGFSSLQIPIARNSPNAMPSVLSFSTYALDVQGCQNPDLCASAVLTNGTVQFQPFTDNGYAVVGVWWDRLPATAALRVGLRLHAQENAVIERQEGAVALMVYGVEAGQCPVGGYSTALM